MWLVCGTVGRKELINHLFALKKLGKIIEKKSSLCTKYQIFAHLSIQKQCKTIKSSTHSKNIKMHEL